MPAKIAYHGKTVGFGEGLNGVTNIAQCRARFNHGNTRHQTIIRHVHQLFGLHADIADVIHARGVAVPSIQNNGDVDIYYVAVHQFFVGGNAVAYDMVDGRADGFGKAFVIKGRGDRAALFDKFAAEFIQFFGRHANLDKGRDVIEGFGGQPSRRAHAIEILGRMDFDAVRCKFFRLYNHVFYCITYPMTKKEPIKAALLIIGNEILSGRTQDANAKYIAEKLGARGIVLAEIRVVPDIEAKIVKAVNELRAEVKYLFTTGGIGPTHDDITADSVAKAFGVAVHEDPAARKVLEDNYGAANLNPARLKMAVIPKGAALIPNPVSGAPGFIIGNVYVMAGVPKIMQGMMDSIVPTLEEGAITHSKTVVCEIAESKIAAPLADLQKKYPDIDIGSYPQYQPGKPRVSLVFRGTDEKRIFLAADELCEILKAMGYVPEK